MLRNSTCAVSICNARLADLVDEWRAHVAHARQTGHHPFDRDDRSLMEEPEGLLADGALSAHAAQFPEAVLQARDPYGHRRKRMHQSNTPGVSRP